MTQQEKLKKEDTNTRALKKITNQGSLNLKADSPVNHNTPGNQHHLQNDIMLSIMMTRKHSERIKLCSKG